MIEGGCSKALSLSLELTMRVPLICRKAMLSGMQDELYNPDYIGTVAVIFHQ